MDEKKRTTINVMPPQGKQVVSFIDEVRAVTAEVIVNLGYSQYIDNGEIILSWYDDFPASDGASVIIDYTSNYGESLANQLIQTFKQKGFNVIGVRPY